MGKAKISKKLAPFSIENMEPVVLKPGVKTKRHDPKKNLSDQGFVAEALFQCLIDGDMDEFKDILRAHYEAVNVTQVLKRTGLNKRTFYDALKPSGNPSLSTVMKMISGLKHPKAS